MSNVFKASERASKIEYAIRDVVVPADELEKKGHQIIKLNLGDPLAYPGLPTPNHMIESIKLVGSLSIFFPTLSLKRIG